MHPNEELIHRFYQSFRQRDAEGMVACYHPEVVFSDPVFPELHGPSAGNMWRMLCQRGKDLEIAYRDVQADDQQGRAHWDADYTFSGTGRKVHNQIDATFRFQDGLIREHRDQFDLYRWMGMALGLKGRILGWLPPVQNAVRKQAAGALRKFKP